MIVIVSGHGARTPVISMHELEQAAVLLLPKGVSNERAFLVITRSPSKYLIHGHTHHDSIHPCNFLYKLYPPPFEKDIAITLAITVAVTISTTVADSVH